MHKRGYSPSSNVFTEMWGENLISCYAPRRYVSHISNIGEYVCGITLGSEDQNIYAFKELQKENDIRNIYGILSCQTDFSISPKY